MWRIGAVLLLLIPAAFAETTIVWIGDETAPQSTFSVIVNEDKSAFRPVFVVLDDNSTWFSPVNVSADVFFSGSATDPQGGDWYLLVCNGTAGTLGGYCVGNELCHSGNVTSGATASCSYNTSGIMSWNQSWFGYACNNETLCSDLENNTAPFFVNHPPTVLVSLTPASPTINDMLTCTPLYSDPDPGDNPTAAYRWFLQDESIGAFDLMLGQTLGTLSFPDFDSQDQVLCEVTPTDSFGLQGTPGNASAVTIANGTLSADFTTATPSAPRGVSRTATVTCAVDAGESASVSVVIQDNRTGSWSQSSTGTASVYVNESSRTLGVISNTSISFDITIYSTVTGVYGFRSVCSAADTTPTSATSATQSITVSPDTTPPVISNVNADPSDTQASITWDTDDGSTSRIDYGTTLALGSTSSSPTIVTSHGLSAIGLQPLTTYYYNITSCNQDNYCTTDGPNQFTTLSSDDVADPITGGYCTGVVVERHSSATGDQIGPGDIVEFYCELPNRVYERQTVGVTVTNKNKEAQQQVDIPDPVYGEQVSLYP